MVHASGVYAMAIAPDGRMIATAQERGPKHVELRDLATGRLVRKLEGHRATVKCVAFAPDGRTLASGSDDMSIRLWEPSTGRTITTLTGHTAAVDALAFSPDGKLVAAQSLDNTVRIWDSSSGRPVWVHENVPRELSYNYGTSLAFSPAGGRLAAAQSDSLVTVWDVRTGELALTLSGHRGAVDSVAFLNADRIVTTGEDRTVKLWDIATGENVLTLRGHSAAVIGLGCRPDGSQLVTTGPDGARVWDTAGSARRTSVSAPEEPDRPTVAKRSALPDLAVTPRIWTKSVLDAHEGPVNRLAYSPDGRTLVTVSDDTTVRLWDAETGLARCVLRGHQAPVISVACARDGRTIATGEGDWHKARVPAQLKVWDIASQTCLASWPAHGGPIWSLAFTRDGRMLASGSSDGLVKLWDPATRAAHGTLDFGTGEWVRGLSFTADGKTLASSHMAVVRLWDAAKRTQIADLMGHTEEITALAIGGPDGKVAATASRDQTVILWNWESRRRLATVTSNQGWVNDVAFSPDGNTLAFGVMNGDVKLWDVASGRISAIGHVARGSSLGVAFSPDGRTLATSHNPFAALFRLAD
jgi:WD40 repeat protein